MTGNTRIALGVYAAALSASCLVQVAHGPPPPPSDCAIESGNVSARCMCPDASDFERLGEQAELATVRIKEVRAGTSLGALAALPKLRAVQVEEVTQDEVDALGAVAQLEAISLVMRSGVRDVRLDALARLPKLARLEIEACEGTVDVSVLRGLTALSELDVRGDCDVRGADALRASVRTFGAPSAAGMDDICKIDPTACGRPESICESRARRLNSTYVVD